MRIFGFTITRLTDDELIELEARELVADLADPADVFTNVLADMRLQRLEQRVAGLERHNGQLQRALREQHRSGRNHGRR